VATFDNLSLTTAGSYTLSASDGALASATSEKLTIIPDAGSSHLVSIEPPLSTLVGKPLTPALILKVEDQFGNVFTTDRSKVTLSVVSGPSGGAVGGTATVTVSKGIATFSKATLSTAGNYTLAATDNSLAITTPVQFSQTITQAVTTVAAPHPAASYTAGKIIQLTAQFKSSAPNTVAFTGTANILDQGSNVLGTATVAANGSVKFSFTVLVANTYLCTLSYPGDTNHTAITSSTFTLLVKPA
jgi:Bacterial Ig-like domain (group 3)